jgi:hypothetical protein
MGFLLKTYNTGSTLIFCSVSDRNVLGYITAIETAARKARTGSIEMGRFLTSWLMMMWEKTSNVVSSSNYEL